MGTKDLLPPAEVIPTSGVIIWGCYLLLLLGSQVAVISAFCAVQSWAKSFTPPSINRKRPIGQLILGEK